MAVPNAQIVVELLMQKVGAESDAELVTAMGWSPNQMSNISKWRRSISAPSYEPMWEMLEKLGWITPNAWEALRLAEAEAVQAEREAAQAARRGRRGRK